MASRFEYTAAIGATDIMPHLPLTLLRGQRSIDVSGLLDTGSAINLLPYRVGLSLGASWEEQTTIVPLVGTLGRHEARALAVFGSHPQITLHAPVQLVFAWVRSDDVPVLFGQVNFFMEFDVCFYRSRGTFDVRRRSTA